jgi:hypothetical protein
MQLPNRTQAYIPPLKLTTYLLSEAHAVGKSKAKFFRALGFDETKIKELEQGLLAIAHTETVTEVVSSAHGTKYIIEGDLATPAGSLVKVRTVWIVEVGEEGPRFVTAYPG